MNHDDLERWFMAHYDEHADQIFRFCLIRVRDREAALDLAHDTFARMWEYVSRGHKITEFRAFAFRVARNAIVDYRKKARPLYERDLGDSAKDLLDTAVPATGEETAELSRLLECLARLPDHDQEIVILRYTEGLPVHEIAESYDEKPNTMTARLTRAIEALRECMGIPRKQTA